MDDKYTISLRDLSQTGSNFNLISLEYEGYEPEGMFSEFVEKTNELELEGKNLDIYIGIWANQGGVQLTKEFIKFCGKYSIPVSVDFND